LVAFSSSWPEESRSPDSIRNLRAMLQSLLAPAFAKSRLPQFLRNHYHRPHAPTPSDRSSYHRPHAPTPSDRSSEPEY
jgi:hypothetical protein